MLISVQRNADLRKAASSSPASAAHLLSRSRGRGAASRFQRIARAVKRWLRIKHDATLPATSVIADTAGSSEGEA